MLRFFGKYGLSVAVAMTILYLCIMPSPPHVGGEIPNVDKFEHILMYLILVCALCKNFYQDYTEFYSFKMIMWTIVAPICFGGVIELLQSYCTTTRSGDWLDWLADILGVLAGYLICSYFYPRYMKRNDE